MGYLVAGNVLGPGKRQFTRFAARTEFPGPLRHRPQAQVIEAGRLSVSGGIDAALPQMIRKSLAPADATIGDFDIDSRRLAMADQEIH